MRKKKLMLFAIVVAFAAAATLPLAAQGNRQQVQGTWFGTGTSACLVATPGQTFAANLTPTGGVSFQPSSVQGYLNINADGTGTGEFLEFALTPLTIPSTLTYPPGGPAAGVSASSNRNSVSFTYTIADDGTLTVTFVSVGGTVLTGPSKGAGFTLVPPPLTGRIGTDGKSMLLSNPGCTSTDCATYGEPTVETLHITNGPSFDRICSRTRVFVPIHEDEGN